MNDERSDTRSFHNPFIVDAAHRPAAHRRAHVTLERLAILTQIVGSFFIQGIGGIGLKEQELSEREMSVSRCPTTNKEYHSQKNKKK